MKTKHYLEVGDAKKILAAAEARAASEQVGVVIVVMDDGGHPIALRRMDDATPAMVDIAFAIGRTAALTGRSSKSTEDLVRDGWTMVLANTMDFLMPYQGALPIVIDGERAGSVAVSGPDRAQCEDIARAGIAALGLEAPLAPGAGTEEER